MDRALLDTWLGHLRRDRRGRPVPYVNIWGCESVETTRVEYDPNVGQRAIFFDDVDGAEPNFFKQHPGRQRECMVRGLCQVCARAVPWSRRNLVIADASVHWAMVDGRDRPVVFEPWLDDRCAKIAIEICPALIRRTRAEQLTLVAVRSQREARLVLSSGWVEGPFAAETQANPVVLWAKLLLPRVNIQRAPTAV